MMYDSCCLRWTTRVCHAATSFLTYSPSLSADSNHLGVMLGDGKILLAGGATAGSAEALAILIQKDLGGQVLGEATYGLGSEAKLYEMEGGSALLVSAALWETASGARWNGDGVEPDEVIRGSGNDYEARQVDQCEQALEFLERQHVSSEAEPEADAEPA